MQVCISLRPWSSVLFILFLFLLLNSLAYATCFGISAQEFVEVEQYSSKTVRMRVTNFCAQDTFQLSAQAPFSVITQPSSLLIDRGHTRYVELVLAPGGIEPGIYEVIVEAKAHNETVKGSFAVKVKEAGNPLSLKCPTVVSLLEDEPHVIWVVVENNGNAVLNNVVVFSEEGGEKKFHDSVLSLSPGERVSIPLRLGYLSKGTHEVLIKALSGEYSFTRSVTVNVASRGEVVSTAVSVEETNDKGGYIVEYQVTNHGDEELKDLFLTVEDAPPGWDVISPPIFFLAPDETKTVELILQHGGKPEANVTISLYSRSVLIHEDPLELSLARIRGVTGLFGLPVEDTVDLGLLLLLFALIVYFGYTEYKNPYFVPKIKRRLGSLWPF